MRVVSWGTIDLGKPRNRILLQGLHESEVELRECHANVWTDVEDKSTVRSSSRRIGLLLRWLAAYPGLVWRYLRLPRHDVVFVGYLGHVDVLVLYPWAKLRGVPIVWDAFISLYDTVVDERRLVSRWSPVAAILFACEWLACRAASVVVLDTAAHATDFRNRYRFPPERTASVPVGAETERFVRRPPSQRRGTRPLRVLFYGQFAPLHGIETVVEAARVLRDEPVEWTLVGTGQLADRVRELLDEDPLPHLEHVEWLDYDRLPAALHESDVCLGIFGETPKAGRVVPNKVYQALATGTPVVTRDSPALRDLLGDRSEGVWLVPPADADALVDTIRRLVAITETDPLPRPADDLAIGPDEVAHQLLNVLSDAVGDHADVEEPPPTGSIGSTPTGAPAHLAPGSGARTA